MINNKIILEIRPQTWVRMTQTSKYIYKTADEKLSKANQLLKRRLIRYNEYKTDLHALAKAKKFELARSGTAVYFFIPIPKNIRYKKRRNMHFTLHDRKPDTSNLLKAFEDALLPRRDQVVGHYAGLGKYWVDADYGWIEVFQNEPVYDPRQGIPFEPVPVRVKPLVFNRIEKVMSPASFDAPPLSELFLDEIGKCAPVDVNNKAAMDEIIRRSKKRK